MQPPKSPQQLQKVLTNMLVYYSRVRFSKSLQQALFSYKLSFAAMLTFLILLQFSWSLEVLASGLQPTTANPESPAIQPATTIFARDEHFFVGNSQTCGYLDAKADSAYTCGGDERCAYVYADSYGGGNWGPFCYGSSDSTMSDLGMVATTCLNLLNPSHSYSVETTTTNSLFW
jgi:hypothetical protein